MLIDTKGTFRRDWKKIRNKELTKSILKKMDEIESAESALQISHLKHLRKYVTLSKIEITAGNKIYWIICKVLETKFLFLRLDSENHIKQILKTYKP